MKKRIWATRLAMLGAVVAVGAGTLVATAGAADAEVFEAVEARVHFTIALSDDDNSCQLTSTARVYLNPATDYDRWVEVRPYRFAEFCGGTSTTVEVAALAMLRYNGTVDWRIDMIPKDDGVRTTGSSEPSTLTTVTEGGVQAVDIVHDAVTVDANGHFAATSKYKVVDTLVPEFYQFTPQIVNGDVTGNATIRLYRDGQWSFSGSVHNGGFSSKDVRVVCAVHANDGSTLLWEVVGGINGTLPSIGNGRTMEWGYGAQGTSPELESAMDQNRFSTESPALCAAAVDSNTPLDVLSGIGIVWQIGVAIVD